VAGQHVKRGFFRASGRRHTRSKRDWSSDVCSSDLIENIKYIENTVGLDALPEKLQEVAIARKKHPEVSLKELGELIGSGKISKSGVNHRLKRIDEFANDIREGKSTAGK